METLHDFHDSVLYHGYRGIFLLSGGCWRIILSDSNNIDIQQETAQKSLEEVEFLFDKSRTVWVFRDRQACKVGAIFDRDMANGEALTEFNGKGTDSAQVDHVEVTNASNVA